MSPVYVVPSRLLFCGALVLASLGLARGADKIPEGWFVWPAAEPLTGSALDMSSLNTKTLERVSVREGHFVLPDGSRIRFWGSNLTGAEAFPDTADAASSIARRLAKGGVNIARLHHLDNPWGVGTGGSIWPASHKEHRELDARQLDRLHRLIGALRDVGIYTNLNLKVSKTLVPEDGFDASVTEIPNFQKRVDIYNRRMIDLQKDYARRLLTSKNPYTGFAPADDPAVAIVEINNENSLLGYWTKDLGRNLEKSPEPFREDLRKQWNAWLAKHYADDAALAHAWAPVAGDDRHSLIPADGKWRNSNRGGAAASITTGADPTTLVIDVTTATGMDWNVQTSLGALPLKDGEVYTVEFMAKASAARSLGVGVSVDAAARPQDPWRSFGLLETVKIGTAWQQVRLVFPAHSVAGAPAALSLNSGNAAGKIEIKELQLLRGSTGQGLQANQSMGNGTVPLPLTPGATQWADWIHFLADTERSYAEELRSYLKEELHVKALILCSQIEYGGLTALNREQTMDFADSHSYWQHPDFPAGMSWDTTHWTIRNTPQLDEFRDRSFGELSTLALVRVAGKPFTISEYDHPAPSEFACEMYPEIASFAARQDWDGVYPFSIGANGKKNRHGSIQDFFDQLHHPAKWSQSPFAAVLFRQGLVSPAPQHRQLNLGSPVWIEQPTADVLWLSLIPEGPFNFLNVAYGVSDRPGNPNEKAFILSQGKAASTAPLRTMRTPQGNVYFIDSDAAAAVVGFIGGGNVGTHALHVACKHFGVDFASVSAVALDRKSLPLSSQILVTVVARAGNQGTRWNAAHNSIGGNWGDGPTIAEHVPATITLAGDPSRVVYALNSSGKRMKKVPTQQSTAGLTFTVGADDHALHYEVVSK